MARGKVMSRWFRHYSGMMRDEKLVSVAVKSKQPVERIIWVYGAILESAAEVNDDGRYCFDAAEAAYFLRADEADILAIIEALTVANRLADGAVVKWSDRQFQSDKSATRQAAYRGRKRNQDSDGDNRRQDGDGQQQDSDGGVTVRDGGVTPPDTDTDTEEKKEEPNGSSKEKRGTRLPDDFYPDATAQELAEKLKLTASESQEAFENFLDYWRSVPGAKGVKLDWQATFRNWLRNSASRRKPHGQRSGTNTLAAAFAQVDAVIDEIERRERETGPGTGGADVVELSRLRKGPA
jgi:hypothetical protein